MSDEVVVLLCFMVAAYLIGGIPFGYLIGRMRGVDVRTVGSRNIGATNVFRTVGKKWGLLAFACDVLKGLIPVIIARSAVADSEIPTFECTALVTGVMCVVGHMLTPYMKFKGGKGVATAFGMLLGLIPLLVGVTFLVFVIVFACSNYISLGSISAAAFIAVTIWFPILGVAGYHDLPQCVLVVLIALFVIWKHRANVERLLKGTENKIYIFKKAKSDK